MLVLSRREEDKITFPNLGIEVEILRIASGKVRVGIDAPPEIKVLRHELQEQGVSPKRPRLPRSSSQTKKLPINDARLKRHLESAAQALNNLHQLREGPADGKSEELIFEVFRHLKSIDEQAAADADREPVINSKGVRSALLVEDNANECRLLASYLRLRRFDVAVAHDGEEALNYLSTHEDPDVVLIDMQMPRMDGPTAVRQMRGRERHQNLKVYAVSGGDPADYGLEISPQGVNGWFPKPLDPETVLFRLAFDDSDPTYLADGTSQKKTQVV